MEHTFRCQYQPLFVVLSYTISVLGAYSSLQWAAQIREASGRARTGWLVGAALAMGGGAIWSMHFIALFACVLPVSVSYDFGTTLASFLIAVVAAGLGLHIVTNGPRSTRKLLSGGTLTGLGVAGMHYVGMAGLRLPARTTYRPSLVAASVLIAVLAAIAAFWIAPRFESGWPRLGGSLVMGVAVCGMHYTGMAATTFVRDDALAVLSSSPALDPTDLAYSVFGVTLLVLALLSGGGWVIAQRRTAHDLRKGREDLERQVQARTAELSKANEVLRAEIEGRVRAEERYKLLEEDLRQAQKMEAVGRLAGGVAHDFNNLLTVINGYGDLLLGNLTGGGELREGLVEIRRAGERATALTRQLLAFSRKQVLQPRVLDLNEIVRELEKMLGRLLGAQVGLVAHLKSDLGCVRADHGQIEQVILNLAVNARDAMPGGGTLTIETSNVDLTGEEGEGRLNVRAGPYVCVSVIDSGVGMDAETLGHIFEPFFTTKEKDKGTGLGLATAYGIVRQSEGHIRVESEPGEGTTFRIYLPRVDEEAMPFRKTVSAEMRLPKGGETVLVVEDEDAVRKLASSILEAQGYTVLQAPSGVEAVGIALGREGVIDLLLTDAIMPGMNGREVAKRVRELWPDIRVLVMSGYTDDAFSHHGIIDPGVILLEKPFTPLALARKVREVLDAHPYAAAS